VILRATISLVAVLFMRFPANASISCMTEAEARAEYHTTFVYWHGRDRCWDNGYRHILKESAPGFNASQHAERLPNSDAAEPGAGTIWPAVPSYSFTDRWPNQTVCLPDRWLHELEQFGR
jgi:hypothetical protein